MSAYSFEELIYLITGNIVSNEITLDSEFGTTYNFIESIPHQPIRIHVAKNANKISYAEAIQKVFDLTTSNSALSSVVVENIVDLFDLLYGLPEFVFDLNKIKNRELKVRLLSRLDTEINSDIVYNVLFFKITGRTLYVKTFREFRRSILQSISTNELKTFIQRNETSLTKYYRRNRSLLLYVKNTFFESDKNVRSLINRISKNNKHFNVPTTNKTFSDVPLTKKPTNELLKMLYASDTVTVRNGLTYVVPYRSTEPYPREKILNILRTRNDVFTDEQKQLITDGWTLALPSSAKKAAGIVPNGSSIAIKPGESFGVRWSDKLSANSSVDLDLSFTTINKKYGWNASKSGEVSYSGDMTSMQRVNNQIQSATEVFTINQENTFGILDIASFSFGEPTTKVELLIGDIAVPLEKPTSTTVLGYLFNNRFYVNVDNKLNANNAISSVHSNTVTDTKTFNNIKFAPIFTL